MTQQTETKEALALLVAEQVPSLRDKCYSENHSPCIREVETYPVAVYEYVLATDCQGCGWTPTLDSDRIDAAIRERGWILSYSYNSLDGGEIVHIATSEMFMDIGHYAGHVKSSEELRHPAAILLAFARALGLAK